jgi:hypothetical protein
MPDTTARPLVHGKHDPGSRVETLATHGLVMIALLGVEGHVATFVPFTPDEARRLGIALVCAADQADETAPPTRTVQGERTLIGAGKMSAGELVWWRTTSARVASEAGLC